MRHALYLVNMQPVLLCSHTICVVKLKLHPSDQLSISKGLFHVKFLETVPLGSGDSRFCADCIVVGSKPHCSVRGILFVKWRLGGVLKWVWQLMEVVEPGFCTAVQSQFCVLNCHWFGAL